MTEPIWSSGPSTSSGAWPWTPPSRPTAATRARRWRWPRWPTCCGPGSCATTRPTPTGPTATASCSRPGHACILQYSMLHLTGLRPHARRPRGVPPVGLADPGPPRGAATPAASRSPPVRSARASPTPSAWRIAERWLGARFGPELFDHHTFVICRRRRPRGGRQPRGGLARRPPRARQARRASTTTTTSRSTARPSCRSPTTPPPASRPTAGTSTSSARSPTTSTPSRPRCAGPRTSTTAVAHRAAQPHRLPVAEVHRHRARPTASPFDDDDDRARPRRSWASPTSRSGCPTTSSAMLPGRRRARPGRPRGVGEAAGRASAATAPRSTACLDAEGLPGWEAALPTLRQPDEKLATRQAIGQGAPGPDRPVVPGLIGGGADLTGNTGTALDGAGVMSRRGPGRPPDLLRRPRARHGRDHERHGPPRRRAARRRHVPRLLRLRAAARPPGRAQRGQGHLLLDPRLGRASARTAPPTSRSSSRRRCGPCPSCA